MQCHSAPAEVPAHTSGSVGCRDRKWRGGTGNEGRATRHTFAGITITLFFTSIYSGYRTISHSVLCHLRSLEKAVFTPILQIKRAEV